MIKINEIKSINLEITNRCFLACDRCARTHNDEIKNHLMDLPLDVIDNIFNQDFLDKIPKDFEVILCGVYGDCIYHKNFIDVVSLLKSKNLTLHIETNGSYKDENWWNKLLELLNEKDIITFSIDGLSDTNHLYRKNSKWDDILLGLKASTKSEVRVFWKYIVFSHNQHQIELARDIATELGVDRFVVRKSGRFYIKDELRPDEKWVSIETHNKNYIEKAINKNETENNGIEIVPRCINTKKNIGITYDGYLFPCCTSSTSSKGWFKDNKKHLNLREKTFEEIIQSELLTTFFNDLRDTKLAPDICKEYCGVPKDILKNIPQDKRQNIIKDNDRITHKITGR